MIREQRDADARLHHERHVAEHELLRERGAHAVGYLDRGGGPVDLVEQEGELVAAQAREQVPCTHGGLQPGGHLAKQQVPVPVAEGVVHLLEAVEVEHEEREAAVAGPGPLDRPPQGGHQLTAVRDSGQIVVECLVAALLRVAA